MPDAVMDALHELHINTYDMNLTSNLISMVNMIVMID